MLAVNHTDEARHFLWGSSLGKSHLSPRRELDLSTLR